MVDDAIVPDDKDWTWVLRQPCPECGFDASAVSVAEVGRLIRANAASWAEVLGSPAADVRRRSQPDRWSSLEYAAHVRDVHRIFRERLALMLAEDDPLFANWDQDETAVAERYGEQDPVVVRDELVDAADAIATDFEAVGVRQWERPGRRSDGAHFTVESFARYHLHDPVHHLWDVTGN